MKYFNKHYITAFLLLALLAILPFRALAEDSVDTTPPAVSIENIKIENGITLITGRVLDDVTPADQVSLELYDSNNQVIDTISPLPDGTWSFRKNITQKPYTLYIRATDTALPNPNTQEVSVDDQRPHVKSLEIPIFISKNPTTQAELTKQIDLLKNENMTRVSLNPTITITLEDNDIIDNQDFPSPITVFSKNGTVTGTASINSQKQIVFSLHDLTPSTVYYIITNPSLTDDAGNSVYPVIRKFTTVSDTLFNGNYTSYQADWDNLPHGYYTNNVNTCINCHNTHVSDGAGLDNPTGAYTPKNQSLMDSYCMACHDGTSAAPMPENYSANMVSKHDTQSTDHPSRAGACTACHNPHLTWSEENPNFLKDHYVYQHKDEDEVDETKVGIVDSRNQLCEKCHDLNTKHYKDLASELAKQPGNPNYPDAYHIMTYNTHTAKGTIDDYNLCFSCHNDQQTNGAKDIQKFYQDSNSKHVINAQDGSMLNGQIPCSECHETHASNNIDLLKEKLGHENQQNFSFASGSWTRDAQKQFCTKCHNGSTAIYGVTGSNMNPFTHGHEEDNSDTCSSCHGGESKSFIEAAHNPKLPGSTNAP